ncbi:uncharacterized protein LOC113341186 [Papaver somniferum]|uniref:uncharacterized protein LOC113341186 n=1 Tax=Papaver somniferum TaxID=3469 RepID=UPI000E7000AB|nr:uncharacterized protein LOC113341186 [Papaver somniferum]XP_026441957.1 uncharacterized protein LOC113341186 [Papaver somniferum]
MKSRPQRYYPTNYDKTTLCKTIGKSVSVETRDGSSIFGGDHSGLHYASTSSDSDAEDNGGLRLKESKRERATERTAHSLQSTKKSNERRTMHRQQENHRTLNKENNAMKQQQQKRYCEKENKRPSNHNVLSKVTNVLTSHMTSKTSNKEGTKKKKLPCQEPNPGTFFQSTSVTNCSSDPDVDSEDNRELCFRESKNEEVKKGPARFSSLVALLPTSKSKNKDMQKQSANISYIPCGPSSVDVFLSCITSKMSIKEETGKHHWEASWYQGIGKPNSMYGPHEMKYWVTVDGYFIKEIIGGYGAIIRDDRGKPIVAFFWDFCSSSFRPSSQVAGCGTRFEARIEV